MTVKCHLCGAEFDPRYGWQMVYGWGRKAAGGSRRGGSDIALRKPYLPEIFACEPCIDGQKHGRSPRQGGLLD